MSSLNQINVIEINQNDHSNQAHYNRNSQDEITHKSSEVFYKKLRSLSNISNTCMTKTVTNCFFNVQCLPNNIVKREENYFPKSKASKAFFNKNRWIVDTSLRGRKKSELSANPIVKNQFKNILRAKSTFIKQAKLQEYYISSDNKDEIIIKPMDASLEQGGGQAPFKCSINRKFKKDLRKKSILLARKGDLVVKSTQNSHILTDNQKLINKIFTCQSIHEDPQVLKEKHIQSKMELIGEYLRKNMQINKSNLLSKNNRQLLEVMQKSDFQRWQLLNDYKYDNKENYVDQVEKTFTIELDSRTIAKVSRLGSRKKGRNFSTAIQDFDLKPWGNKEEERQNDMIF